MARQNILSAYEKMQKGPDLGQFQQLFQSEQRIGAHKGNRSRGLWNIASQVGFGIDKKLKDWQAAKQSEEYGTSQKAFENDPDRPFKSGSTKEDPIRGGKDPNSLEGLGGFFKYLGGSGEKGKYSGWAESSRDTEGYDPSGEKDFTGIAIPSIKSGVNRLGEGANEAGKGAYESGKEMISNAWQGMMENQQPYHEDDEDYRYKGYEHGDLVGRQNSSMMNVSRGLGDLFGIPTGGGMEQNNPSGEFVEPSEQDSSWYDNMSAFEKYFFNKEKNKANMNYKTGGTITSKSGEKVSGMEPDTQLIVAQPGEFVIKKDAVQAIGIPYLRKLNALKMNKGGYLKKLDGYQEGDEVKFAELSRNMKLSAPFKRYHLSSEKDMKGFGKDFDKHMEDLDYFDTLRKSIDKFNEQSEVKPMNEAESKVWSKYIGQGTLARSRMSKNEVTILDSLIKDKLMRLNVNKEVDEVKPKARKFAELSRNMKLLSTRVRNQRPVAGQQRYQYQEGDLVKKDNRHPKEIPNLKRFLEGSRMGGGEGWLGYDEGQWAPGVNIGAKGRQGILGRLSGDELEWIKSNRRELGKDLYKYVKEEIESRPTNIRQVLEDAYEEAKGTPFTSLGMLAGAGIGYNAVSNDMPKAFGAVTGLGLGGGAGSYIDNFLEKRRQIKEEEKLQR